MAAAAPPAAAAALGPVAKSRLRRLVTVGGTLLILFILWETFTFFVAYTDDAYVRSDLVAVAPEVTGPITTVHVVDNQTVKKGDKLVSIDPVPFQLDVNQRQAQIDEAAALLKVAQEQLATAKEALVAATSSHTYAVEQQARFAVLAASNNAPRAELDRYNDELRRATAEMNISQVAIAKARDQHQRQPGRPRRRQGGDGDGAMAAEPHRDRGARQRHHHQSHHPSG